MFKKSSLAIAAVLLASSASSFAATSLTSDVKVSATLTPVCTITSSNITVTYTSFQTEAAYNTSPLNITCTNGQAYNLSLNTTSGSVLGLNYSVALVDSNGATVTGGEGKGTLQNDKLVKATIGANQGGTVSGSSGSYTAQSTTIHTVTLSY